MSESGNHVPAGDLGKPGPSDISDPMIQLEARRAFVWLGVAGLFALVVLLSQSLLVIFGGIVFAALIDGGSRLLGRVLHIGRNWRVAIVLLASVLFFVWLARFAGSQISEQAAELPAIVERQADIAINWLASQGFNLSLDDVKGMGQQIMGGVGQVTRAVGGIIGAFTTLVMILVLGIYFAVEPRLYQRGVAWMLPMDKRERFRDTAAQMAAALRRLLAGRLLGMVVEGFATWALLAIYGVPMAILLALITGLLAFLPNIGAIISGLLMVLVGFSGGWEMGLYTVAVYAIVQTVDGYLIVPMIARKTVDLPPALVLGAQLIMGVLFGLLGLILADPMVAMLKVWLESSAKKNQDENLELS